MCWEEMGRMGSTRSVGYGDGWALGEPRVLRVQGTEESGGQGGGVWGCLRLGVQGGQVWGILGMRGDQIGPCIPCTPCIPCPP